jgi:hypothetical protein
MRKSLVLEGPDNSGKSTLARALSAKFKMPIIQAGPPPRRLDHLKTCCEYQVSWMMDRGCIFDRVTPISHQCYHDVEPFIKAYLDEKILEMREYCWVIYCPARFDFTSEIYESEQEKELVIRNESLVADKYSFLMQRHVPDFVFLGDTQKLIDMMIG